MQYIQLQPQLSESIATPAVGSLNFFVDSIDNQIKLKDSSGNYIVYETGSDSGNATGSAQIDFNIDFKSGSIGPKVSFVKENNADPEVQKDVIIPGVLEITRGNNQGLYNIAIDNAWVDPGPTNTLWNSQYIDGTYSNWNALWNIASRTYGTWKESIDSPEGNSAAPQQVGMPMILKETTTDRYWLIMFTQWTPNNGGGGFAYDRWEIFPEVFFEKIDYETSTVDQISAGVSIARGDSGSLYNSISEVESIIGQSPLSTKWNSIYTDQRLGYSGFSDLSNLENRVYTDFSLALDYAVGNNVLDTDLIMHDLTTDLYYKFQFQSWTNNANGGGFSYNRTVIPQSTPIKFADGTVINTAALKERVYRANMKAGVDPTVDSPVVNVLENSLGGDISWALSGTTFVGTFSAYNRVDSYTLDQTKVYAAISIGNMYSTHLIPGISYNDSNNFEIVVLEVNSGDLQPTYYDADQYDMFVEIRVYN